MAAKWRPGELDQRITIKREQLTPDGFGGQTVALNTYATLYAAVRPARGREYFFSDKLQAEFDCIFVIRNRPDLSIREDDRIEWLGQEYNIQAISLEGGRTLYLEIAAKRGGAQ